MPVNQTTVVDLDSKIGVSAEVVEALGVAVAAHVLHLYGQRGLEDFQAVGPGTIDEYLISEMAPKFGKRAISKMLEVDTKGLIPLDGQEFDSAVDELRDAGADEWIDAVLRALGWKGGASMTPTDSLCADRRALRHASMTWEDLLGPRINGSTPDSGGWQRTKPYRDWPPRAMVSLDRWDDRGWDQPDGGMPQDTVSFDQTIRIDGEDVQVGELFYETIDGDNDRVWNAWS